MPGAALSTELAPSPTWGCRQDLFDLVVFQSHEKGFVTCDARPSGQRVTLPPGRGVLARLVAARL